MARASAFGTNSAPSLFDLALPELTKVHPSRHPQRRRSLRGPGFVTAICPTRNRRSWIERSIRTFQRQTYQPKELLVVEDGNDDCSDLIPDGVRYLRLAGEHSIGWKRNFCCEHAHGSIIVHWDDDDWSHPERISEQVAAIEAGAPVVGYHTIPFDGPGDQAWLYSGHSQYALGTSLCYRRDWWRQNPFPNERICEDEHFVRRATAVIQCFDGRNRMVATTHQANTSPRNTRGRQWSPFNRDLFPREYFS